MNSLPLVVSFYTLDTPYEEEVKYLQASCEAFQIEHKIQGIPSAGSWEVNCAFKPIFILEKMEEYQRPLLWVDADAVFVRALEYLPVFTSDLGVRIYSCAEDHPSKIVSATVFINYTEAAKKVIKLWAEECLLLLKEEGRTQEMWDQDALRRVLFTKKHDAQFSPLPVEYSKIIGHPEDEKECLDPVIVQNQASRRYKRWVNHPEERIRGW
jgi:hypothetical protein